MLSIETEDKLARLLLNTADHYQLCQDAKKSLNSQCGFDAYEVYCRLDRGEKGYVDAYDLVQFYKEHYVFCSLNEALRIVMWFDYDCDERLAFAEVVNMICGEAARINDACLRKRQCLCLGYNVEMGLCEVMQKELDAVRALNVWVLDVRTRYDFSIDKVMKAMKGLDGVGKENVRDFMIRTRREFYERDVGNVVMRFGIMRKAKVSREELERIFYYPNDEYKGIVIPKNEDKEIMIDVEKYLTKPKQRQEDKSMSQSFNNSFNSSIRSNRSQLSNKQSNEDLFISFLTLLVETESNIEQMKLDLSLRGDFNAEDAFKVFESSTSSITPTDLRYGLHSLGLSPSSEEIDLLMRKYSLLSTNTLNYADLFDMLCPFDKDARRLIEKRQPSPYTPKYNKTNCFLGKTKSLLVDLIEYIILSENKLEILRRKIDRNYTMNLQVFCEEIDRQLTGSITNEALWEYIHRKKISNDVKASDLLFIRLDRDRDGKLAYEDIIQECKQRLI